MIDTGLQIANLMADDSMSAPEMTHALKVLGNGSMHCGFQRIGKFFSNEIIEASFQGLKTGRIQGCFIGAAGTLILGGVSIYAIRRVQQKKRLKAEGKEILRVMNESTSLDDISDNPDES